MSLILLVFEDDIVGLRKEDHTDRSRMQKNPRLKLQLNHSTFDLLPVLFDFRLKRSALEHHFVFQMQIFLCLRVSWLYAMAIDGNFCVSNIVGEIKFAKSE